MDPTEIITRTKGNGSFDVVATWRGHNAGHAYCLLKGERLKIGDMKVEEPYRVPWRGFGWLRLPYTRVDCRHRGIGTEILKRVLSEAAKAGIVEVWGEIVAGDLARKPDLVNWYQDRGFTISEPDGECSKGAVKKITKMLK
jgi:GNAT superfamily N-acetyltransferase